jgi:hypothetical protein
MVSVGDQILHSFKNTTIVNQQIFASFPPADFIKLCLSAPNPAIMPEFRIRPDRCIIGTNSKVCAGIHGHLTTEAATRWRVRPGWSFSTYAADFRPDVKAEVRGGGGSLRPKPARSAIAAPIF